MDHAQSLAMVECGILRAAPALAGLDHVVELLVSLLDASVLFSLPAAAAYGSVRLLNRVISHMVNSDIFTMEYKVCLAIEAAVKRGVLAIVQRIHELHPTRLPVRILPLAASTGNLPLVQWLFEYRGDGVCMQVPLRGQAGCSCCLEAVYKAAIKFKHLHIVRWLYDSNFITTLPAAGDRAARVGDLEMVKWIHALNLPLSFSIDAINRAARHGHYAVVEFLIHNRSEGWTRAALNDAYFGGHHAVTSLLHASGSVREELNAALARRIARHGRVDLLDAPPFADAASEHPRHPATIFAYSEGNFQTMQYLVRHPTAHIYDVTSTLAANGYLDLLQHVHDQGTGRWPPEVMPDAARSGHLAVVQWLRANRPEACSTGAMRAAAGGGHIHIVQWLHANWPKGCSAAAMDGAAEDGHLDVVIWLHENRSEGCTKHAMDRAAMNNHVDVVKWLHTNRSEGCTQVAINKAAINGHLEMVQWLHRHRHECSIALIPQSASPRVLKWLLSTRPPMPMQFTMNRAAEAGDLFVLKLLHEFHCEGASIRDAAKHSAVNGHLCTLQWLDDTYPSAINFSTLYEEALRAKQTHVIEWVRARLKAAQRSR